MRRASDQPSAISHQPHHASGRVDSRRLLRPAWVLVALVLGAGVPWALARGGFETVAYKVLKLEDIKDSALAKSGCQLCHVNARGGPPWNAFGLAVGKFRAKKLPVDQAIFERLKLLEDADQDGYSDVLEVFVGTLPGDANSKPSEAPEATQAKLEAAGGVERYKPTAK